MKKRLILILMVLVLAAIPLTGCENSFKRDMLSEKQDTTYTVKGNGGNAVQYGNFIYFINGYRGYEDTDGNSNVWNKVTKGALYRVKLLGEKVGDDFVKKTDPITKLEFASNPFVVDKNEYEYYLNDSEFEKLRTDSLTIETDLNVDLKDNDDYEPNPFEEVFYIDDVDYRIDTVERVASKVIGTSGYSDGGIFIFDNYIYYASPNNDKNKSGLVQSAKTDFFRTDLNGTKTERIYSTSSDTNTSPYGFYKQGNYTYLVVLDGSNIVSVKMNSKKVVSKNIIADNATSAYFPTKEIYNAKNNTTNSVEDFVYYTRDIEKEDGPIKKGNCIEVVRPNGKNRFELVKNGRTTSIEAVRDGLVFYRSTNTLSREELHYTNMHQSLQEYNGTSPYSELVAGIALEEIRSEYKSIYCFRPNAQIDQLDNNIYILGFTDSAVYVEDINSRLKIINEQAVSPSVYGNTLYYANISGAYYSANMFVNHTDNRPVLIEEQSASGAIIRNSFVAGYFVFMGTVDTYANAYAKFYPLDGSETAKSIFIGERIDADIKQPPADA